MCGIAGMAGTADELTLREMLSRIRHRGPDDTGMYVRSRLGPRVAIGNNRLSILDLSCAGHQPMANEDKSVWVAYNGEIYNFTELRQELLNSGHEFHSGTDTEILPHLYEQFGPAMVNRLNGIFAFALWDEKSEQLWLFRDRMGVKPLYYTQVANRLYFASEIKALLACPEIDPVLDIESVPEYLAMLYVPNPGTMFKGIFKLPPGHQLLWKNGKISIQPYWNMRFGPAVDARESELAEEFQSLMVQATRRQLISDVPVGFFLSGGLDSSTLVASAAQSGMSELRCYSIAFSPEHGKLEQSQDDARFARVVADRFGATFREVVVEPDVTELLPKVVWHLDEPVADHAAIATYLLCQAAKPEVTVLLSGQGADEVFGGYRVHLANRIAGYLASVPAPARNALAGSLLPLLERYSSQIPLLHQGLLLAACRFSNKINRAASIPESERYAFLRSYFTPEMLGTLLSRNVGDGSYRELTPHLLKHLKDSADEDPLHRLLYADCKTFLPDLNLAYSDKLSMACSIELRVPFLDNEIVDFALRLPSKFKIKGLTQKYIIRKALHHILPGPVLKRRKAGFGLPIRSWLRSDLRETVHDLLSERRVRERGLFQPAAVARLIEDNESGQRDHSLPLWALLTLELWQQTFLDSRPAPVVTTHSRGEVARA